MNTVYVALIIAVLGPVLLSVLLSRQRRKEKLEDRRVEDQRHERDRAETRSDRDDAEERAKRAFEVTNGKLDVIEGLVNSNVTALMQTELDQTEYILALLQKMVALENAGNGPSMADEAAITRAETKIVQLTAAIAERRRQDAKADAQLAASQGS